MNETHIFKSRRNRVWRDGNIVYKQILLHPGETVKPLRRTAFEADTLEHLYSCGVCVPKIISHKKDLLSMEYIKSATLTDFIETAETGAARIPSDVIVEKLICWFEAFYAAMPQGCIRGDVNCRNFLVAPDGNIAGVDFEASYTGSRETDLGKLIAFILTYHPQNTVYKKHLTDILYQQFKSRFNLNPALISHEKNRELNDIIIRRKNN